MQLEVIRPTLYHSRSNMTEFLEVGKIYDLRDAKTPVLLGGQLRSQDRRSQVMDVSGMTFMILAIAKEAQDVCMRLVELAFF